MSKRARTGEVVAFVNPQRRTKRPIAKQLIVISKTAVSAQVTTTLITATFPCTITGLRWVVSAAADAGTAFSQMSWAIVKVTDGNTPNTLSGTDGATFYAPEQDVLAFGKSIIMPGNVVHPHNDSGSTKTMRKLQAGDQVFFLVASEATNTIEVQGVIQFFCMT